MSEYAPASVEDLRLLFFSGGSALRDFSRFLPALTGKSAHLVTTFDSGGSAGALRRYFAIPALGDLRSRLAALAENSSLEQEKSLSLWEKRFNSSSSSAMLVKSLKKLAQGGAAIYQSTTPAFRQMLPELLTSFCERMPEQFDLRGACLGNLALAGAYFKSGSLQAAVDLCAVMLGSRGSISPISEERAHLAARLASGRVVLGQHNFSAKFFSDESSRIFTEEGAIKDIWLVENLAAAEEISVPLAPAAQRLIEEAELICYPPGSFYSSLLANLLPAGVGRSISLNPCPKVFMPNPGVDPEVLGRTLQDQVEALLRVLLKDAPSAAPAEVLDCVLVDSRNGMYPGGLAEGWLAGLGVALIDCRLVEPGFQAEGLPMAAPGSKPLAPAKKRRPGKTTRRRDYERPGKYRRPWLHIAPEPAFAALAELARAHKK